MRGCVCVCACESACVSFHSRSTINEQTTEQASTARPRLLRGCLTRHKNIGVARGGRDCAAATKGRGWIEREGRSTRRADSPAGKGTRALPNQPSPLAQQALFSLIWEEGGHAPPHRRRRPDRDDRGRKRAWGKGGWMIFPPSRRAQRDEIGSRGIEGWRRWMAAQGDDLCRTGGGGGGE